MLENLIRELELCSISPLIYFKFIFILFKTDHCIFHKILEDNYQNYAKWGV